jgi:hypothetical protein
VRSRIKQLISLGPHDCGVVITTIDGDRESDELWSWEPAAGRLKREGVWDAHRMLLSVLENSANVKVHTQKDGSVRAIRDGLKGTRSQLASPLTKPEILVLGHGCCVCELGQILIPMKSRNCFCLLTAAGASSECNGQEL